MTLWRAIRLGLCGLWLAASPLTPASAGPHEGGMLIPHVVPSLEYSFGVEYEGLSNIRDCKDAITEGRVDPETPQVWYVLASFANSPGPIELAGVTFGFRGYDPSKISFVDFGGCNRGYLDLPSPGWPGPNEGTALIWENRFPRTEVAEVYWFAAYVYGSVAIELGPDPTSNTMDFGAPFPENSPPEIDEVYDWGMVGFGEEGYNPCNWTPQPGSCCVGDMCYMVMRDECESMGGVYGGDNTDCFPNPCDRPVVKIPWGRIKRLFRSH